MLIQCPECTLPVSDKAIACPHCGLPLKKSSQKSQKSSKRRRLPNGFGQISKLNGYHRNPYRAMVTVGKNKEGKPICKLLKPQAYFETYNEAYTALVEYNKNPYDLDSCITMSELYDKWFPEYKKRLTSTTSIRTVEAAWRYCGAIYSMPVKSVRARHLKGCIEDGTYEINGEIRTTSNVTKSRMKSILNLMFDYAVQNEITDQNYARQFNVGEVLDEKPDKGSSNFHKCFTEEELELLWNNSDQYLVVIILVQIYSGWRPQELGLLKVEDIDLNNWTFKGGMKTDAGRDRIVPIHPKIREFIKEYATEDKYYLFPAEDGSQLTYSKYSKRFKKVMKLLGMDESHRAHDPRKQFITMCKNADVDEYAIKRIVGHAIDDVTEKVYTERSIEWLHKEIAKIS